LSHLLRAAIVCNLRAYSLIAPRRTALGGTVSANPLSENSPSAVGLTFSSDIGVFSQSETYYFSLNKFKDLLDKGRGYLLIQGELVSVSVAE